MHDRYTRQVIQGMVDKFEAGQVMIGGTVARLVDMTEARSTDGKVVVVSLTVEANGMFFTMPFEVVD